MSKRSNIFTDLFQCFKVLKPKSESKRTMPVRVIEDLAWSFSDLSITDSEPDGVFQTRLDELRQMGYRTKEEAVELQNMIELERFLIYIYDKDLFQSDGSILGDVLRDEFDYYFDKNVSFPRTQLVPILMQYGLGQKSKDYKSVIIDKEVIHRLIVKLPSYQEFKEIQCDTLKYVSTVLRKSSNDECLSEKRSCFVCHKAFDNNSRLTNHLKQIHNNDFKLNHLPEDKLIQRLFSVTYKVEKKRQEISFKFESTTLEYFRIQNIYLYNGSQLINVPFALDATGEEAEINCNKMYFNKSRFKYSLLVQAASGGYEIIEQHHYWVKAAYFTNLRKYGLQKLLFLPLEEYKPRLENRGLSKNDKILKQQLNPQNYVEIMRRFVEIEDWAELLSYDNFDQKVEATKSRGIYKLHFKTLSKVPKNLDDDICQRLIIIDMDERIIKNSNDVDKVSEKNHIFAVVKTFDRDHIFIEIPKKKKFNDQGRYMVRFVPNRMNVKMEQYILDHVEKLHLSELFFPKYTPSIKKLNQFNNFDWFNPSIIGNAEQKQAVRQIVNGTAHPAPYILFGPPGTGKTMTLVETIAQIWKLKPQSNVLVTAQANSACDEIAERLLRYIPPKDILRYYSDTAEKRSDSINQLVYTISNFYIDNNDSLKYLEIFRSYRIVLVTLAKSGWFNLAKIDPDHFDYVIIDECGSATETSALIPIAGVVASEKEILANVVLAGDPKQLGPVLSSPASKENGHGISMLERFMNMEVYHRNGRHNKYNSMLITKLIRNYRSHPAILKVSNEMFYGGELQCLGRKDLTEYALNWKYLPNPAFPIIFHSVVGETETEGDFSSFNLVEIELVLEYIEKLLQFGINEKSVKQTDIGVVTPYRKQCLKIRSLCNDRKWNDIEVGSVEQYQGREKKVMILTTVRSKTKHIGFLDNPKRFNVALTRAQALLIVIGNANTLQKDRNWARLIKYCQKSNAFKGPKSVQPPPQKGRRPDSKPTNKPKI